MRTLARNMAFLIKSIALGKEKYGLPEKEAFKWYKALLKGKNTVLRVLQTALVAAVSLCFCISAD